MTRKDWQRTRCSSCNRRTACRDRRRRRPRGTSGDPATGIDGEERHRNETDGKVGQSEAQQEAVGDRLKTTINLERHRDEQVTAHRYQGQQGDYGSYGNGYTGRIRQFVFSGARAGI